MPRGPAGTPRIPEYRTNNALMNLDGVDMDWEHPGYLRAIEYGVNSGAEIPPAKYVECAACHMHVPVGMLTPHESGVFCFICAWRPDCRFCGRPMPEPRLGADWEASTFIYDHWVDHRCTDCWPLSARAKSHLCYILSPDEISALPKPRRRPRRRRRTVSDAAGARWLSQARKRIADYGFDSEVREFAKAEVVEQQGSESCAICQATDDLVLDHVHPLAAGGSHTLDNVRLLCAPCNGWEVAEIDRPLIEARRGELRRAQLAAA